MATGVSTPSSARRFSRREAGRLTASLKLNTPRERTIDNKIRPADKTCGRARHESHRVGDLLRIRHASSRVQRERLSVERRIVVLDPVPYATFEIHIPGRHRIGPNTPRRQLISKALHVVNKRRFKGPIGSGRKVYFTPGD